MYNLFDHTVELCYNKAVLSAANKCADKKKQNKNKGKEIKTQKIKIRKELWLLFLL